MKQILTLPSDSKAGAAFEAPIYRPARDEDAAELTELINRGYGIHRDLRYWQWKFQDNPAGRALSCLVERDGRCVAHFGGLPARFIVQGIPRLGVQDVDDFVEAELRTFRGAAQLNRCRVEINRKAGADFLFGFSIEETSQISQMQFGYELVDHIPRLVRVLDYRPLLGRRRLMRGLAPLAGLRNRLSPHPSLEDMALPAGTRMESIDRFDQRFDRFWQTIAGDYPIMVIRDAAYLNWRYVEIPSVDTARFALLDEGSGEVCGFIVLSENYENLTRGRILELVTPRHDDGRIAIALLAQAFDHFRQCGAALVAAWMLPHCHLYDPLLQSGFRPRRDRGRDIVFRNSDLSSPAIPSELATDPTNWFLTMGDSDLT